MRSLLISLLAVSILLGAVPRAESGIDPAWLKVAQAEAARDGYRLIRPESLKTLVDSAGPPLLLDVRTKYEFLEGHLNRAIQMEFGLGDLDELRPSKKERLLALLGPDRDRPIVIYDASLNCPRAAVAAHWVSGLGYRNVHRLVGGWRTWARLYRSENDRDQVRALSSGEVVPDYELSVLAGKIDRRYLGLAPGTKNFLLKEIGSERVLVWMFNTLCLGCQNQAKKIVALHRKLASDPERKDLFKIIGLGVGSKKSRLAAFRRTHRIRFPLFADPCRTLYQTLGSPILPGLAWLVRDSGGGFRFRPYKQKGLPRVNDLPVALNRFAGTDRARE